MNWKSILTTVVIVMLGIYAFKWVNAKWRLPIVGTIVDGV